MQVFFVRNMVVGVGFEPTNSEAERIYSPRPLATWIPHRVKLLNLKRGENSVTQRIAKFFL